MSIISVIIPVYNAEDQLQIIIDCLKKQTFSDFEVLLIDDGSTDQSGMICDEIVSRDNRYHVIHQKNQGVSVSRNRGIEIADGEYIAFLDADDEIPNNFFEELIRTQDKTKADIVACDVVMLQNGTEVSRFSMDNTALESKQALELLLSRRKINSGPCAKLIKAKIIEGVFFESLKVYEDILFVKDLFEKANTIAVTNRTEYRYVQHNNSAMHFAKMNPPNDIVVATGELIEFIERHNDLSPYCFYTTVSHLFQYVQPLLKRDSQDNRQFVKEARLLIRKHIRSILKCRAFPRKEKVLFLLFSVGIDL